MKIIDKLNEDALIESEKAKPSSDPAFWAKRSCSQCYGRGVRGVTSRKLNDGTTFRNELTCPCAEKNFRKWRDAWVKEYVTKHS